MAEFHPLPTGSRESKRWLQLNLEAIDRTQRFIEKDESGPSCTIQQFLQHLTYKDYEYVYEPAEDTYLLLDAIRYEVDSFPEFPLCLEIGVGTGIVSATVAKLLPYSVVLATDVNPRAVASAKTLGVAALLCDLSSGIRGSVDILIFNPPYVPTPDEEIQGNGLEVSWAGGADGRKVIDRWVDEALTKILARPHGICYLITVDDNHPEQLAYQLSLLNMSMKPLFRRRAKNEYLTVQKITWIN